MKIQRRLLPKNTYLQYVLAGTLLLISVFQTANATETNCSFKLAEIQFTKCLNGAEKMFS